ncbi:hypothetical protein I317_02478 [Kwoniella heveanensis CBS 569]|uniref:Uncharacterized protein n=1 Tax=Kwoniella heveanensis BCC8398 TaxID=1296120 RepID=A0A1B9GTC1_9TREE|nr:hypothetical protein I316_04219 [Kwoniella heveanensis BCC8398]OCF43725.1 hypothetical protein I317_02478 [Kwoniella heveanensis CBS 569]
MTTRNNQQFEEADVVHQYHYGTAPDETAIHSYRPHHVPPSPGRSASGDGGRSFMGMGHRQPSAGSIYPPVPEDQEQEREDLDEKDQQSSSSDGTREQKQTRVFTHVVSPPEEFDYGTNGQQRQYQDPYAPPQFPGSSSGSGSGNDKSLQPNHRGLSGLFHFNSGPDLSFHLSGRRRSKSRDAQQQPSPQELSQQQRKGSADREDKHEYPNLGKKDRHNQLEKEERAGLVSNAEIDSPDSYGSEDDAYGGEGGVSPMTMDGSHVGHDATATIGTVQRVNLAQSQPQPQPAQSSTMGSGASSAGGFSASGTAQASSAPMSYSTSAPQQQHQAYPQDRDREREPRSKIPPSQSMGNPLSSAGQGQGSAAGQSNKPQIRVDTSFSNTNSSPKGPRLPGSKPKQPQAQPQGQSRGSGQGQGQGQDPPGFAGPRYQ